MGRKLSRIFRFRCFFGSCGDAKVPSGVCDRFGVEDCEHLVCRGNVVKVCKYDI